MVTQAGESGGDRVMVTQAEESGGDRVMLDTG